MKYLIVALPLVFTAVTSAAQNAYSDLMHALQYSQAGANATSSEAAATYASQAFYGSSYNSGHTSGYSSGATVSHGTSGRRSATNMSNIGLKTSSSGYNRGAELARYYAEQRAERARREAERRERMIASYMEKRYAASQERGAMAKAYIYDNSNAKPLSEEAINDIISNGLSGNFIIDDDGDQYFLPEYLLEGSEISDNTLEILEEKFKKGEELSDEEWDILIAQKKEEIARLEEEKRQLEEANRNAEEELDNKEENLSNQSFDDISKIQYNELSKNTNESDDNTLKSRNEIDPDEADLDEINLDEVDPDRPLYINSVNAPESPEKYTNVSERDGLVFPIDSERIKNIERDEREEKLKKRIDSTLYSNQKKTDAILMIQNKNNTTLVSKDKSGDSNGNESSLGTLITETIETYQVGSGFIQKVDEGSKYINDVFGLTFPGSEQLSNLNSTLSDLGGGIKEVRDMAIIIVDGNLPKFKEKLKAYATDAVAIAVDPYLDKMVGVANTFANTYTKTTDIITNVGNPFKKAVSGYANTVLTGALEAERTGDYGYYDRVLYKETTRFSGRIAKITKSQLPK